VDERHGHEPGGNDARMGLGRAAVRNAAPAATAARTTETGDVRGLPPHLPPNVRREGGAGDVLQQAKTRAAESADTR